MAERDELAFTLFCSDLSNQAGDTAPEIWDQCERAATSIRNSKWLAEHDREVRAPLQELIEEAREALASSSIPVGVTEAEHYRILASYVRGVLSRDVSDDAGDPRG